VPLRSLLSSWRRSKPKKPYLLKVFETLKQSSIYPHYRHCISFQRRRTTIADLGSKNIIYIIKYIIKYHIYYITTALKVTEQNVFNITFLFGRTHCLSDFYCLFVYFLSIVVSRHTKRSLGNGD